MNESQMKKLVTISGDSETKDLIDCMGLKNIDLSNSSGSSGVDMDPNSVTGIKSYWNSGGTIADTDIAAALSYAVLMGWTGSGIIELGGYDYHSGAANRAAQDASDNTAGLLVGKILRMASVLNKKVFIYLATNGSVVSNDVGDEASNARGWVSDFGPASCVYGLYFDPAGRMVTSGNQIGGYTQGQIADSSFYTGGSPELTAMAIFANYMQLSGMKSTFESIVGNRFDMAQWSSVVKFT